MKSSRFIVILKALDGFQLKRFEKFLSSPYFNSKEELTLLFRYTAKYFPDFDSPKLDKSHIIKCTKLSSYFSDTKSVNKALNSLLKCFEQFIYFETEKHNYQAHQLAVSKFYGTKGLNLAFERSINLFPKSAKDISPTISEELHYGYLNQKNLLSILTAKMERTKDMAGIGKAEEFLDAYYCLEKLRLLCERESRWLAKGHDPKDFSKWSDLLILPDRKLNQIPAVDIFYQIYQMLNGTANESLALIIEKTRDKINSLSTEDLQSIIYLLLGYCIHQINAGYTEYNLHYLKINKLLIEQNHLLESGMIVPYRYKNIASAGAELGEFEWTANFIEDYKRYLPEQSRDMFYRISVAVLELAKGNADNAHKQLIFLGSRLDFESLAIRKLQMKIYFEKGEWDVLESHINAFDQFLRRNKTIRESIKHSFKQLLHYTNKLMDVSLGRDVNLQLLHSEISQEVKINDKSWLIRQLNKLSAA